jgi:hypothetical protein
LVQILDGGLTYAGLRYLGMEAEANPIVAWYTATMGPEVGLVAIKLFAMGCGIILHIAARPLVIVLLTGLYVGAAIVPWLSVLARMLWV